MKDEKKIHDVICFLADDWIWFMLDRRKQRKKSKKRRPNCYIWFRYSVILFVCSISCCAICLCRIVIINCGIGYFLC